ncbi:MAG: SpoIIE family protein phosphatase [Acidobacteria bacterium]|nr:SpoIIE family protein phosphatase [Acidobacteriota bacterium]MYJ03681.1 SpoIIE family protein phosphatase [Acidobacteriota bacterium]
MMSPARARIGGLALFAINLAYAAGLFAAMFGPNGTGTLNLGPVLGAPLLLVPFGLLMLRPVDRNAWLLALMCSGFFVFVGGITTGLTPGATVAMAMYRSLVMTMSPALFAWLFLVFPARTPLDDHAPGFKWGLLVVGAALVLTSDIWPVLLGAARPADADGMLQVPLIQGNLRRAIDFLYIMGAFGAGLYGLIWNASRSPRSDVRRKTTVLATGTALTVVPWVLVVMAELLGIPAPQWLGIVAVLNTPFLPAAVAYAVVRHRVMAIPVLLRRSARYLLVQRGLAIASVLASILVAILLVGVVQRLLPEESEFGVPGAVVLAVLTGVTLARTGTQVERQVSGRIDRLFFRESYNARNVLEALAEHANSAAGRDELAEMLEAEIDEALHPATIAIYLEDQHDRLTMMASKPDGSRAPRSLDPRMETWAPLAGRRKSVLLPIGPGMLVAQSAGGDGGVAGRLSSLLHPVEAECLAPLAARRDHRLVGLIALGPRLSEEPYSREDLQLLDSIADHAALTVENIGLSEEMAERLEAQRAAEREIEVAQDVQRQLLPARAPELPGFVCAGHCTQAKSVGGDYYDFIPTGSDGLTLVLADVAGKGIAAALLMANLHAILRGHHDLTRNDPIGLLERVNRQFYASTPGNRYATLFLANFDRPSGRLLYVNCGHVPPRVTRADGGIDKLETTGLTMGMFDTWIGESATTTLHPGETLVVCSDGVPEAMNDADELFGDERFDDLLCTHAHLPVPELITAIKSDVQAFAGDRRSDDLTLLVARVTA